MSDSTKNDSSHNNGGSTDYYKFDVDWIECGDIIEARKMNYNQGNIFKAAFTFNVGRHDGTDAIRDLNKIIYFAERQKALLIKEQENGQEHREENEAVDFRQTESTCSGGDADCCFEGATCAWCEATPEPYEDSRPIEGASDDPQSAATRLLRCADCCSSEVRSSE